MIPAHSASSTTSTSVSSSSSTISQPPDESSDALPDASPGRYGVADFKAYRQTLHGQISHTMMLPDGNYVKLLALVATLAGRVPHQNELKFAEALLACVQEATIQLHRLHPDLIKCAYTLGEETWAVLDRMVPGGIHTVQMPPAVSAGDLPALARALSGLQDLRRLDLPVPRAGDRLDLSALRLGYPDSFHLHLEVTRNTDWLIKVPQHTHVHARGAELEGFHPYRSLVVYTDTTGALTGEHHPLEGVKYFSPPPALGGPTFRESASLTEQQNLMLINTNCKAEFPDAVDDLTHLSDRRIVCRHITIWVLEQWRKLHAGALQGSVSQQVYQRLATPGSVSEHVLPWTERVFRATWAQRAAAAFISAGFGSALRSQFERMAPGTSRQLMLTTTDHAMALQLHIEPMSPRGSQVRNRYVMTFFDPNRTVIDRTLALRSPAEFENVRFSDWGMEGWDGADRKSDPSFDSVLRLWDYPGIDGAPVSRGAQEVDVHHIPDAQLRSPRMLGVMVESGLATYIPRCVDAIVRNSGGDSRALTGMLAGDLGPKSALAFGVDLKRDDEVAALLRSLMAIDPARLDRRDLPQALNPVARRNARDETVLEYALRLHPRHLGLYTREVLGTAGQSLDGATRLALMEHANCRSGTWLAHLVGTFPTAERAERQAERAQALHEMLQAILVGGPLLLQERVALLNGTGRRGEAWLTDFARALGRGDALPAAILLCHLYEHGGPVAGKPGELPGMAVDQVLAALSRSGSDLALEWADRLAAHRNQEAASELAKGVLRRMGVDYAPLACAEVLRDPLRAAAMVRELGQHPNSRELAFLDPRPLNGRPLLHALVEAATPMSPTALVAQEALHHLVHELPYRWFDATLMAAMAGAADRFTGGFGTAAQAALRPDPDTGEPVARDAAAAMVCAVLEATVHSEHGSAHGWMADKVLATLGIGERLGEVLGPRPAGWPAHRLHWSERILLAVSRLNPHHTAAGHLARRAAELGLGVKVPKEDKAALDRFRAALRAPAKRQWRGEPVSRDMAELMRGLVVVGRDSNPALVVCRSRKKASTWSGELDLWRSWNLGRVASERRPGQEVDLRAVYLLPLDGFEAPAPAKDEAARFETKASAVRADTGPVIVHAAAVRPQTALLAAPAVTLAGASAALRQACLQARLHPVGDDPARAGHVLCVADAAIGALSKFGVATPADAKSSQARGVFYSIPATQLEALPAGR